MPIYRLTKEIIFPPPDHAEPDGLLAVGGDLCRERLLLAYRLGIFPWYAEGQPILWWSPDPRLVLDLGEFHLLSLVPGPSPSGPGAMPDAVRPPCHCLQPDGG